MSEFLLELFCEEIPARFQRRAAEDLKKSTTNALVDAGLNYESAAAFVTPRRIALTITGLPKASPDKKDVRKGPRVGAPEQALQGFMRGAGLSSIDEAKIESDPKKGEFYVAIIEKKGSPTRDILAEIMPQIINGFSWAKSMRWGEGKLNWVRPLRSIVAILSNEHEEPEIVNFEVDGIKSGNITFGHRFMAPEAIQVKSFDEYNAALEKAHVVLDIDRRKEIIKKEADQLAFAQGLNLIVDEGLADEVAGLVEWPVVMMGSFEESFLTIPKEAIIATIRANQKCFCLNDKNGALSSRFILVSNMVASDGGKTIVEGNERVIHARLSDALFFYNNDLKMPLEDRLPKLKDMVFHAKLGSQAERVERIVALATKFAPLVGADVTLVSRAAQLAKADLVTEMVNEFASLQGLMGRYYALKQGEPEAVANAIELHYKPLGPTDKVPPDPVAIAVALADKLDLLTGFWAIDEKPTGSRDPFALRRAALGVIRILVENDLEFALEVEPDLLAFFHERLKGMLRDQGARHDLVDAVISEKSDDMLEITRRVAALSALLGGDIGKNLLAGYRRAANIVVAEEEKDKIAYSSEVDSSLLTLAPEKALASSIANVRAEVSNFVSSDNYQAAMLSLSSLQQPVDEFFDAVMVNDDDKAIRANRLNLLASLRDLMHMVADFSKIEG